MNLRIKSEHIRHEFITFLENRTPEERLWLINNIGNYFCLECGEEVSNCLCIDEQ
jgi:hypothetical protein